MNRRDTIAALVALGTAPFAVKAQQPARLARIANFGFGNPETAGHLWEAAKRGLRELGYLEGQNVAFEIRWALGKYERVPDLAKELVALKPDAIVVGNSTTALALQKATGTIPIVIATLTDPVGIGLVKSLAHPGGNITGVSSLAVDFSPKLLELLLSVVPKLSRVAIVFNPSAGVGQLKNLQSAAQTVGVDVLVMEAQTLAEIENAFARMAQENVRGAIVTAHGQIVLLKREIAELAIKNRIPSVFMARENAEAGGLISYGSNYAEQYRRAATYVDKILKGAKPGDLPIEQASTFELVVNLKTAKTLGITIPQSVLIRADEVIR